MKKLNRSSTCAAHDLPSLHNAPGFHTEGRAVPISHALEYRRVHMEELKNTPLTCWLMPHHPLLPFRAMVGFDSAAPDPASGLLDTEHKEIESVVAIVCRICLLVLWIAELLKCSAIFEEGMCSQETEDVVSRPDLAALPVTNFIPPNSRCRPDLKLRITMHKTYLLDTFMYANGGSLVDLLTGSSRLPWISRTKIANDIASGVGYLHERQLIHRDLSSQNILIRVNHISHGSSPLGAASPCPPSRSPDKEHQQEESSFEDLSPTSAEDNSTWLTIEQLVGYRRCSSLSPPAIVVNPSTSQLTTSCTDFSAGLGSLREPFSAYSLRKITPLTARSLRRSPGDNESSSASTESPELASAYTAIVGDLGLCLDLRQKNVDLTTTVGNPYFTAPECLKKRAPYSPAADVFSFGILLCELITCLVNDGLRIPRTPVSVSRPPPPPPPSLRVFGLDVDSLPTPPDCPSWLLDLAVRCCNVEHTCRPLVKEINQILRYHLSNWCGGLNSSHPTPTPVMVDDSTFEHDADPPCASPARLQAVQTPVGVHPSPNLSTATVGNTFHDSHAAANGSNKSPTVHSCSSSPPPPPSISYERLTIGWKITGRSEPPDRLESVHLSAAANAAPSPSSLLDRPTATFALPDRLA
ncbi:unnamed protein product [Schistocephalus solidus]|uniref:dual-specificity kinase n=1 Tax=Schistocephalus solidus TaxID=70667 RepID=A0A3P7CJD3_SCHSO|nr:unnamed protein product [Schistocephalus solidus]